MCLLKSLISKEPLKPFSSNSIIMEVGSLGEVPLIFLYIVETDVYPLDKYFDNSVISSVSME